MRYHYTLLCLGLVMSCGIMHAMDDDESLEKVDFSYLTSKVQIFVDRKDDNLDSIKQKIANATGKKSQSLGIFFTQSMEVTSLNAFWKALDGKKKFEFLLGEKQSDGKYKMLLAPKQDKR